MNKVARAVYQAQKDKTPISANIRLKKNGQFSSVSGVVEDLKVSRDGVPYVTVKKGKDEYQNVRLDNIICVNKDDKVYHRE
jgi:hypothetical protein